MAAGDDNSDVEAMVMKSLSYVSPAPEELSQPSPTDQPRKRSQKRSRKKTASPNASLPLDTSTFAENLVEVAKFTEERALRLALINSQTHQKKQPLHQKRPPNDSTVFQAPDIEQQAPKRLLRSQDKPSGENTSQDADAAEIVEKYRREVGRFGSSALHKRDRKIYETTELVRLGCRKPKNEKMPIGILTKKRKYQKIRETRKKEMDLATGMLVRTTRK